MSSHRMRRRLPEGTSPFNQAHAIPRSRRSVERTRTQYARSPALPATTSGAGRVAGPLVIVRRTSDAGARTGSDRRGRAGPGALDGGLRREDPRADRARRRRPGHRAGGPARARPPRRPLPLGGLGRRTGPLPRAHRHRHGLAAPARAAARRGGGARRRGRPGRRPSSWPPVSFATTSAARLLPGRRRPTGARPARRRPPAVARGTRRPPLGRSCRRPWTWSAWASRRRSGSSSACCCSAGSPSHPAGTP